MKLLSPFGSMLKRLQRLILSIVLALVLVWSFTAPALALAHDKQTLVKSNFDGKDLRGDSFDQSNMRYSTFLNADLRGTSFFGTNLTAADFTGADLSTATLDTARMTRANFTNAILVGAFVTNTKFEGAIVDGADFTDVLLRSDVQKILCKTATGTNPKTGRNTRETLDCP